MDRGCDYKTLVLTIAWKVNHHEHELQCMHAIALMMPQNPKYLIESWFSTYELYCELMHGWFWKTDD